MALLSIRGLKKTYPAAGGRAVQALRGVDLELEKGQAVGLVGESGCGKTTLARTALRLIEPTAGQVFLSDVDITALSQRRLRPMRRRMQMIFQDPMASLNPRMTVAQTVAEPLQIHRLAKKDELRQRTLELLERVGLGDEVLDRLAHQLSAGQRQRVGIARALASSPELLVADEPIAALDVSIQAQIVNVLLELRQGMQLALLFVSHDLRMVRHLCDDIAVMYLGKIVERVAMSKLEDPDAAVHPYTAVLSQAASLRASERLGADVESPSPLAPPAGCAFYLRCPFYASHQNPRCREQMPDLVDRGEGHFIACHEESSTLAGNTASLIDSSAADE